MSIMSIMLADRTATGDSVLRCWACWSLHIFAPALFALLVFSLSSASAWQAASPVGNEAMLRCLRDHNPSTLYDRCVALDCIPVMQAAAFDMGLTWSRKDTKWGLCFYPVPVRPTHSHVLTICSSYNHTMLLASAPTLQGIRIAKDSGVKSRTLFVTLQLPL